MDTKKTFGNTAKSLIELDKERLTDEEESNRAGDIEVFYEIHFKKVLALKELQWLRSMGEKDWTKESREHAVWHQGALFCLEEMKLWFERQVKMSRARFDKEEEPEPGEIFPPVERE